MTRLAGICVCVWRGAGGGGQGQEGGAGAQAVGAGLRHLPSGTDHPHQYCKDRLLRAPNNFLAIYPRGKVKMV